MGDDGSKRNKAAVFVEKIADHASTIIDVASSTGAAIGAAVEAGAPIVVPFTKFLPLISEIGNIFNEIVELAQAAEHNKRTCDALLQRVYAADLAVLDLKVQRNRKDFFNNKNYLCLQNLVNIITQIRKFISDISQMKSLIKYIQAKNIEKTFKELCKEFDSCVNVLSFAINVKTSDEIGQLKADQDDLLKYLVGMEAGIKKIDVDVSHVKTDIKDLGSDAKEIKACLANLSKGFSSTVVKVNAMNNTMEKFMNENSQNQTKIDNIFQVHPLKLADYERDDNEKPRKNGRVTKWYKTTNKGAEFAFKTISEKEDQKIVQNQVTILKELHDWQNIIKFYGIISDGNKWYLVTEWAECGNLREFYQNKHDFDLKLKLRISLDIARGLNFLRTVEIVHRDIRAENILITLNETAKLANFKLSRYLTAATLNQSQNLERVRYCAPELLERAPNYKYDQKCEVYSFGILLWEIAEERIPYQGNDDILDITDRVRNKMYREPFSEISQMPEEFKQLEIDAVQHDPDFRPKITKMFEVLRNCVRDYSKRHSLSQDSSNSSSLRLNRKPSTPKPIPKRAYSIDQDQYALPIDLPDFESFKYMTLTDAAKQHKLYDKHGKLVGNVKIAYKCFEAYANLGNTGGGTANRNQIKAKYYKAYYISRGLVDSPPNKDKIVAELFKEVADDEANEFPEAKVRYGDCLYHGKGVDQNFSEALKYFEKAAEDGFKVAMYNAGNIYYNGISGIKDKEKAIHYMKLAAYNDYEPAIKFCKEHNL
ncbi:kinase-like domain-containing protein [Rhizophagus diaphanus]|nr:kinase-like domain-containing protein [Rhizophagus diaphanus] [Rhizophagus sp. MUCL 43196]